MKNTTKHLFIQLIIILGSFSTLFGQKSVYFGAPDWSPKGNNLVYISNVSGNAELYIYNLKKKKSQQITNSDSSEWSPSWSPDGSKIAFITNRDGNKEVYTYNLNTKIQTRITNTPEEERSPSWFPDSKKMIMIKTLEGNKKRIMAMDDDGIMSDITPDTTRNYIYPSISPDGGILLFGSKLEKPTEPYHVWAMNLESGVMEQLDSLNIVSYNPSWSTDGEEILFINQASKDIVDASIYRMKRDGSNLVKLLNCEGGCFQPRVSPDGKSVVFRNGWMNGHKGIYVININTQVLIKLMGR